MTGTVKAATKTAMVAEPAPRTSTLAAKSAFPSNLSETHRVSDLVDA